mmetsp:Transcript_23587/g.35848  ORF Transcript_23587/g.35848 Transcript_23587/m.35848 type:complete len:754 (+) Transcript_23587:16-2277(+)
MIWRNKVYCCMKCSPRGNKSLFSRPSNACNYWHVHWFQILSNSLLPQSVYDLNFYSHDLCHLRHILVSPSTHVDHDVLILAQRLRQLNSVINRVTRLQCRNDPLVLTHHFEPLQRLLVGHSIVLGPPDVLQVGVLWTNTWVIQSRADTVGVQRLPALFLNDIRQRSLQHTGRSLSQRGAVLFVLVNAVASRLHPVKFHCLILHERVERPNGIGPASYAGNDNIREFPSLLLHLPLHLVPHNALKVPNDRRERMRPHGASNEVVRVPHVRHPIPHGLVDSVLQRRLAVLHGHHLRPQGVHSEHIELLTFAVHGAHVNRAVQAELGADGGCRHAVLSSSSLSDDTRLADFLRQKRLSDGVVDLVRSRVRQILPLQPDGCPTAVFGQSISLVKGCGTSHEVLTVLLQLGEKVFIVLDLIVLLLNLAEGLRKRLGDELSAEPAEAGLDAELGDLVRGGVLRLASEDRGLVRGGRSLLTSRAELRHDLLDGLDAFGPGVSRLLNGLENGTSDHHSISQIGHALDHLGIGDSEPDRQGKAGLLPHPRDEIVEVRGQIRTCSRHAGGGNAVDERGGGRGQVPDALIGRRGRDEGNIGQSVLVAALGERGSLLRGQINDDESVGTMLLGLFAHVLDAVLEEGVVVSHEYDGYGEALFAGGGDHGEALVHVGGAGLDGDLVRLLDGGAISLGIGVGDAEFDDGGSTLLHGEEDGGRVFLHRKSSRDKGNECRLSLLLALSKCFFNTTIVASLHRFNRHDVLV